MHADDPQGRPRPFPPGLGSASTSDPPPVRPQVEPIRPVSGMRAVVGTIDQGVDLVTERVPRFLGRSAIALLGLGVALVVVAVVVLAGQPWWAKGILYAFGVAMLLLGTGILYARWMLNKATSRLRIANKVMRATLDERRRLG